MNYTDCIKRIAVYPPKMQQPIPAIFCGQHACQCEDCQRLIGWCKQQIPLPTLNLVQVDALFFTLRRTGDDCALEFCQALIRRAWHGINNAELPIKVLFNLEQQHCHMRNLVDQDRAAQWFEQSLCCLIGASKAEKAIKRWANEFPLWQHLEQFDTPDGMPFNYSMRKVIRLAAEQFHREHAGEL